jgi:NAD(P)-dependent dehydrogenase (short-subunit alcohol dehydrogenase family)
MSKRILITGAATGFGKGAAFELARRGHSVTAGVLDSAFSQPPGSSWTSPHNHAHALGSQWLV